MLGASGAGKSTLLKSIIGMVHIESGSVKYQGEELVGRKSHEIIPMGISIRAGGAPRIFADATGYGKPGHRLLHKGRQTRRWTRKS